MAHYSWAGQTCQTSPHSPGLGEREKKKKERKNTLCLDASAAHALCFVWGNPFTEAQTLWNGVRKVASQLPDTLLTASRDWGKSGDFKNLENTSWEPRQGKPQVWTWFWSCLRLRFGMFFHISVTLQLWWSSCQCHGGMEERKPSPSPLHLSWQARPSADIHQPSATDVEAQPGTAQHIASPQLAVWAKPCLEPSSFQPRVTPTKSGGALSRSNKEQTEAWQALMSWCWSCNCLIEFAFH